MTSVQQTVHAHIPEIEVSNSILKLFTALDMLEEPGWTYSRGWGLYSPRRVPAESFQIFRLRLWRGDQGPPGRGATRRDLS